MAASGQQPFEVNNFSGGINDDLYEQDWTTATTIDNLVIEVDGTLSTRIGSVIDDETNGQIPAGIQRVAGFVNYAREDETLLVQAKDQIYYRDPSAYTILTGPTGNDVYSVGDTVNVPSFAQWNRHVYTTLDSFPRPMKIYKDDSNVMQVRTNGLPYLATDPVVTPGGAGLNTYTYAFHYEITYMVGDQQFEDVGPVTFVQITGSLAPDVSPVAISAIPVLSNGSDDNWDTTNIKVFIYRTIDSGETFYKIGEVTNGTTTFNDNFADTAIQDNLVLYTDDGTLDFEPQPECKYVHIVNNTGYAGVIQEDGQVFLNRVRQSIPSALSAWPSDFYIDLEDQIVGIGSTKSVPIIFCRRYVYRIEQGFDRFGRGQMVPIRISDTAGCVSNLSIVQAENYCLWWGVDGIYASDGYAVQKISDRINLNYKSILATQSQTNRVCGKFDETDRRVHWGCQRSASSLDNDILLILDMRWGIKPQSTFTTWSGGNGDSFRPSALEFFDGQLYRGDSRGYVFIHHEDYVTDPKVNTLADPDEWNKETIIWTYASLNINFGSTFFRKKPTRILLTCANEGNTTIQISAVNDGGAKTRHLKIIRWRRGFTWGDPEFVWGNPDCVWNSEGLIEQWRRFPAGKLRLSYVQIVITNGFGVVTTSDIDGEATFDSTAKTITLGGAAVWPEDVVDYFIKTEVDDYDKQYLVTARNSDTVIEVQDTGNTLPAGLLAWELWGYRKGEKIKVLSYNIHWNPVDQNQMTFQDGQDGTNA